MTISLRISDDDTMLIKKYAEINKISVSDLIRQSVMERTPFISEAARSDCAQRQKTLRFRK